MPASHLLLTILSARFEIDIPDTYIQYPYHRQTPRPRQAQATQNQLLAKYHLAYPHPKCSEDQACPSLHACKNFHVYPHRQFYPFP